MIVFDTHIWIWWIHKAKELTKRQVYTIMQNEERTIGISAISCWEIAKLVAGQRLHLPFPLPEWFAVALRYPGIRLLPLNPPSFLENFIKTRLTKSSWPPPEFTSVL